MKCIVLKEQFFGKESRNFDNSVILSLENKPDFENNGIRLHHKENIELKMGDNTVNVLLSDLQRYIDALSVK